MESGDPIQFIYRPLPDSKTPDQTIRFDSLLDAWDFADNLQKICIKRGVKKILKQNRAERREGKRN